MGQIPMQIKCRADSAPEKDYQHDGQIRKVETMEKAEHAQNLQSNQYNKNQQMEFFVFKHAAEEEKNGAANRAAAKSRERTFR